MGSFHEVDLHAKTTLSRPLSPLNVFHSSLLIFRFHKSPFILILGLLEGLFLRFENMKRLITPRFREYGQSRPVALLALPLKHAITTGVLATATSLPAPIVPRRAFVFFMIRFLHLPPALEPSRRWICRTMLSRNQPICWTKSMHTLPVLHFGQEKQHVSIHQIRKGACDEGLCDALTPFAVDL